MMFIEQQPIEPDITVLRVQGRITAGRDSQELEWKVEDLLNTGGKRIVLDIAGVTYLDSTGLGIIVTCGGKLKKTGGELRISGATGTVAKTLVLCKVPEIIPVFATLEQAASSFDMAAGAA